MQSSHNVPTSAQLIQMAREIADESVSADSSADRQAMRTYRITRSKLYPTPGTNYRVAWKWLYDVELDGARIFSGYDRLDSTISAIRRFARSRGETAEIVKAWN